MDNIENKQTSNDENKIKNNKEFKGKIFEFSKKCDEGVPHNGVQMQYQCIGMGVCPRAPRKIHKTRETPKHLDQCPKFPL